MRQQAAAKKTINLMGKNSVTKKQAIAFLKVQRITNNISQQEIADRSGNHINAINRLENQGLGSDDLLAAYARAIGFELDKSYNFIPIEKD